MLALSSQTVGVDLERIRPIDWQKIAAALFPPGGTRVSGNRPTNPHNEFFRIWTLKESYLKAEGTGFSISPASFAVLPDGEHTAHLLRGNRSIASRGSTPFPGYCLSVCSLEEDVREQS